MDVFPRIDVPTGPASAANSLLKGISLSVSEITTNTHSIYPNKYGMTVQFKYPLMVVIVKNTELREAKLVSLVNQEPIVGVHFVTRIQRQNTRKSLSSTRAGCRYFHMTLPKLHQARGRGKGWGSSRL